MRILITGARGFIGAALLREALSAGLDVRGTTRSQTLHAWEVVSPTLACGSDWSDALRGVQVVVHTAGKAHVLQGSNDKSIDLFRSVNVDGTAQLAKQAADAGVHRFIFISSIGVNGNQSKEPFTESDQPRPEEPYALSKLEAEGVLWDIGRQSGMEIVILRPPLVYGPEAPGNFRRLLNAVKRGAPLPLGAITENRRTLVALDNLIDLILVCVSHPAAANQVFLAGDSEDLSTTDLLRRLAQALEVPLRLLPVPIWLLSAGATVLGKRMMVDRLCGSLQVNIGKARELLGWTPPVSVDEALKRIAQHHLKHHSQ